MDRIAMGFLLLALALAPVGGRALNKQGSRDPCEEAEPGFASVSGSVAVGAFAVNPSYAARPDNTGLAAGRLALHADLDVFWGRVTVSYDAGAFTASGKALRLSELDQIVGLSIHLGPLEAMVHYEKDLPMDRGSFAPSVLDAQLRLDAPCFQIAGMRLAGYAGLGPVLAGDFPARPDNTGQAALRGVVHLDVHPPVSWAFARLEVLGYTDRPRPAALSELDLAVTVGVEVAQTELSILAETDRPVDRGGPSQAYVAVLVGRRFGGGD